MMRIQATDLDADDVPLSPFPMNRPAGEPVGEITDEEIFGSKAKARAFQWRERNRERLRATSSAYYAKNADAIRLKRQAKRATKKAAQLAAKEQRREELKSSLLDPSAVVLLGHF